MKKKRKVTNKQLAEDNARLQMFREYAKNQLKIVSNDENKNSYVTLPKIQKDK